MLLRLFLLFTLVPLVELLLLLRIGALVGLAPTLLLVMATGFAGAWLARREGLRSWAAVQAELGAGRLPAAELLHSLLILIAGVVLVTPGVLTDLVGLLLLIRPVRRALIGRLRGRFERALRAGGPGPGGLHVFRWSVGTPDRPLRPPPARPRTGLGEDRGEEERDDRAPRVIEL